MRMPNLKVLWKSNDVVRRITAQTYLTDILNGDPEQVWLLLFAKTSLEDYSIRAKQIYDELAPQFPEVKFGFVDISRDELLKVTFDVESVPWTFCIYGGRAYRLNHLEQSKKLQLWLEDIDNWKSVEVQFDLPTEIAGNMQLYMYYVRKDYKRVFNFVLGIYVDLTGPTELPNVYLAGFGAVLILFCVYKCVVCICCRCCGKKQIDSEKEK